MGTVSEPTERQTPWWRDATHESESVIATEANMCHMVAAVAVPFSRNSAFTKFHPIGREQTEQRALPARRRPAAEPRREHWDSQKRSEPPAREDTRREKIKRAIQSVARTAHLPNCKRGPPKRQQTDRR
ncbi:hypothetical protein MRX96_015958 [Rhipicephalus microplus]